MLVLSRHRDEEIVIGEGASQAVVTVTEIRGDKVLLGVTADLRVPVHRREVYESIQREQSAAEDNAESSLMWELLV